MAVLRAREGERSSLRALCSVERLDMEWAGEVAEAALRGGEPSSSEDAPRAGGEASSTLVGRGDSRGVKAAWGNEPTVASIGGGGFGVDRARAKEISKPALKPSPHVSVAGFSEVGQGVPAIFSKKVNFA